MVMYILNEVFDCLATQTIYAPVDGLADRYQACAPLVIVPLVMPLLP